MATALDASAAIPASGIIGTYAGTGTLGFSGDAGPARSAKLSTPAGLAFDTAGNLFIADQNNHRVRKVSTGGTSTTFAGDGRATFAGDGGPATRASLNRPDGLAFDAAGNLYIADYGNNRVRRVTPAGVITTFAGNGTFGFSGDGGPATRAALVPTSVAIGTTGVYIADAENMRIRKVGADGVITTYAGSGVDGFSGDGGPAGRAAFSYPRGLAVANGAVYIADVFNNRVRKVVSGVVTTVAGNGQAGYSGDGSPASRAPLTLPGSLDFDQQGNLYISGGEMGTATFDNANVRKVSPAGVISTVAGNGRVATSGDGGRATAASLDLPWDVAIDSSGNVFVSDHYSYRVRVIGTPK